MESSVRNGGRRILSSIEKASAVRVDVHQVPIDIIPAFYHSRPKLFPESAAQSGLRLGASLIDEGYVVRRCQHRDAFKHLARDLLGGNSTQEIVRIEQFPRTVWLKKEPVFNIREHHIPSLAALRVQRKTKLGCCY
jgi:hypothetical protein